MLKLNVNPKKYIKTQARSLPIVKCLINVEWEALGMAHIVVARQHKNGNFTAGTFIIDTHCLGLKDTCEYFNMPPDDFYQLNPDLEDWIEVDYTLVHNVIYGAIAYADDYGFKPHKDFNLTQFLLEEDDEKIELIELEFGINGSPCFKPGPFDDPVKTKNTISILERTAGPGNYMFIDPSELDFDDDDEFEDDWDDEDEDEADHEDLMLPMLIDSCSAINIAYDNAFRTSKDTKKIKNYPLAQKYEITHDVIQNNYNTFDSEDQELNFVELHHMVVKGNNPAQAIPILKKAIAKWPDKPLFYNILQSAYHLNGQDRESNQTIQQMLKLFPGYLFAKISYINMLIDSGDSKRAGNLIDNKADLNELYPDRNVFHFTEIASYFATLCRYYTALEDFDLADAYMQAIFKLDLVGLPGQTVVNRALIDLSSAKMRKLEEM